jgi:hypothetical protein
MNAKKAKALRKVLKNLTQIKNEGSNLVSNTVYTENIQNRKMITVQDIADNPVNATTDGDGSYTTTKKIPIAAGTITLSKNCARGVYKKLKKSLSKGIDV